MYWSNRFSNVIKRKCDQEIEARRKIETSRERKEGKSEKRKYQKKLRKKAKRNINRKSEIRNVITQMAQPIRVQIPPFLVPFLEINCSKRNPYLMVSSQVITGYKPQIKSPP